MSIGMTGLCRAPLAASLLASLLMNEDIVQSMGRIESLRNVQLKEARKTMGGAWMDRLVNEPCVVHAESNFYLAGTRRPSSTVVHAGVAGSGDYPLCKWKKGGTGAPPKTHAAKLKTPEEAKSFSDNFCQDCFWKLSASRRTQVKKVFNC